MPSTQVVPSPHCRALRPATCIRKHATGSACTRESRSHAAHVARVQQALVFRWPQFSADGRHIVFLYRIGMCPRFFGAYFRTYVFTIDITGQHLWRVPVVEGAYHDFGASGRLLVADKV